MTLRPPARPVFLLTLALAPPLRAQQLIGYVNTRDAQVTGASDVLDGQAVLSGSVSITAKDHTAPITLGRGGTARVCQTSVLHVTESREVSLAAPLLFSLDRGAIELQMNGTPSDAIMTPDLRFTVRNTGPLDLRLRVARNGDTCVDNRGPSAPTLAVSDPFGESMYELHAGQHVLFEHGSLHEVVDSETSSCGCPEPKGMSMADALLAAGPGASSGPTVAEQSAEQAAAEQTAARAAILAANKHPFPDAISAGLAPVDEVPAVPPGETYVQIADTLSYNAPSTSVLHDPDAAVDQPISSSPRTVAKATPPTSRPQPTVRASGKTSVKTASAAPAPAAPAHPASAPAAQPPAPPPPTAKPAPAPPAHDLAHAVGRFFRKLFGGH